MNDANRYYVYKLTDPRTGWPFYIGKGTGGRTWQHLTVDRDVAGRLLHAEGERIADDERDGTASKTAADDERIELSAARRRVQDIRDDGLEPGVEWLISNDGKDMGESTAFAVEAALIDLLRSLPVEDADRIVNKVSGHRYAFGAHASLAAVAGAQRVDVPADRDFVVVSSKGVWGGNDSTGQFAGATRQVAWDNAREAWPMGVRPFRYVNEAAGTESPVILLGLAADPLRRFSNVVVCVEELSGVVVIAEDDATRAEFAGNKRFTRPEEERASTTELRRALMRNAPFLGGDPLRPNSLLVYRGPWHAKVVG